MSLSSPSPNPFALTTSFSYVLLRSGPVRLSIFDVQGRQVRTLIDAKQAIGHHQVTWDALDDNRHPVPPGIYFAQLHGEGAQMVRKIVRVR